MIGHISCHELFNGYKSSNHITTMATKSSSNSGIANNQTYTHRCLNLIYNVGGMVYRHILLNELDHRKTTLQDFLEDEKSYILETIPYKDQYRALFPGGGTAIASCETFDIPLIAYLLKTFFIKEGNKLLVGNYRTELFSESKNFKPISYWDEHAWRFSIKENFFPWNTNIVADIARIKEYRNLIHDVVDTKNWLSEAEFKTMWSDISAVLLNLARGFGIPNMFFEIENVLHEPLDPQRQDQVLKSLDALKEEQTRLVKAEEDRKQNEIKNLNALKELEKSIKSQAKVMETEKVSLQESVEEMISEKDTMYNNLKECSEREMNSQQDYISEKVFVKTRAYIKASECLAKKAICVLCGNHGEGKSTIAFKLISEHSKKGYRILQTSKDWRSVNFKTCGMILIDDIFGVAVLEKHNVKQWRSSLGEVQQAVLEKAVLVIITIKPHILEQAKAILTTKHLSLFEDENVVDVTSEELSDKERNDMLVNHLNVNKRVIDSDCLRSCVTNYANRATTMFPIGFPQCVNMFATIPKIFEKGISFFKMPIDYIKQCLLDMFKEEKTFSAFYFLWSQPNQKVIIPDLEKADSSSLLQKYNMFSPNDVKKALLPHKNGFINYCDNKEDFSFSNDVIVDVVGLIVCDRDFKNGIELCSLDFVMSYVTTGEANERSDKVFIKESRFEQLCNRLVSLNRSTNDGSVLRHDAFKNEKFIEELKKRGKNEILEIFYNACCYGNKDLVTRLLNFGLNYKEHTVKGFSPIHSAAYFGHVETVDKLVENDREQLWLKISEADEKWFKYEGATLLHIAVLKHFTALTKKLLSLGADGKIKDSEGNTPLLLSIKEGQNEISRTLIPRFEDEINTTDNNFTTPLIEATRNETYDIVKTLTNKVNDMNCKNKDNQTALDIAIEKRNEKIQKLLKGKGAKTAAELVT